MDTYEVAAQANGSLAEMAQLINSFPPGLLNIVPFEGSWTAGQVGQHIVLSASGFIEMINGPVRDTQREPDENVANIKESFLNFNIKMVSPDFVVPPFKVYQKEELSGQLEELIKQIEQITKNLDLTKTCIAFELPGSGFLTRLEAIHFILYHTQRHIHQLKNIQDHVMGKSPQV